MKLKLAHWRRAIAASPIARSLCSLFALYSAAAATTIWLPTVPDSPGQSRNWPAASRIPGRVDFFPEFSTGNGRVSAGRRCRICKLYKFNVMAPCSKIGDVGVSQEESDDRDFDDTDKTATPRKKKRPKRLWLSVSVI